ncbi:unnamed protein product [Cylicocyclus nassatus]|uniref:Uncharacterized protein n=1 Tax=Cylicocyclus nassatus TaxID=53992 RepID=A0AA36HHH0_CYLNA|nr:unnamed protein product [Cylicocyclus nassatus]
MKLVLLGWLAVILSTTIVESSVDVFPLHRMSRSQLPLSSLLVPYPRVGKRSAAGSARESDIDIPSKRIYVARVGKRAFMYTARVGK